MPSPFQYCQLSFQRLLLLIELMEPLLLELMEPLLLELMEPLLLELILEELKRRDMLLTELMEPLLLELMEPLLLELIPEELKRRDMLLIEPLIEDIVELDNFRSLPSTDPRVRVEAASNTIKRREVREIVFIVLL